LGNAIVSFQPDDALLDRIREDIDSFLPEIQAAPERPHAFLGPGPFLFEQPEDAENRGDGFPDCVISGKANPMGVAAHLYRDGHEAVGEVVLGAAFEGAPGRAHGGIVAALIDETMGLVLSIERTPGFTGRLTITYRAPTPLGVKLQARARLTKRDGRKLIIEGELHHDGQLLAQAVGLFIAVDTEKFLSAAHGQERE
jgi:acyl-coenzyme A thioesterase PaaI-like protein